MKAVFALLDAAFLLVAPTAHADDQTYIDELNNHGVLAVAGPKQELKMGHQICDYLHAGNGTPNTDDFLPIQRPWAPQIIDAAQHQLCPDTLR